MGIPGYDEWLYRGVEEHFGDWQGKTCDKCGANIYVDDMHDDEYYDTPGGCLCWNCAYDDAYDAVQTDYPELDTESDQFEQLVGEYMGEWRR